MLMELLAAHDQFVADLPPDDQEDDFLIRDIIQDTEVAHPEFELGHRVGPKLLDRLGRCPRLIAE
jgi:hypothetical protein